MFIYRSTTPSDSTIYSSPEKMSVDGFTQGRLVYHVQQTKAETNADYTTTYQGVKSHFIFSTPEGKAAFKKGGRIEKTLNPRAVTCPACRTFLKLETTDLETHLSELEAEESDLEVGESTPIADLTGGNGSDSEE